MRIVSRLREKLSRLGRPDVSAAAGGEKEADMLFTVIADMRALLRGEHSDTSLSDAATSHSAETPSEMQARHRRSEACLEMQSKLLRAATRLERERAAQHDRFVDSLHRLQDEMDLQLDTADREAATLDARMQRLVALLEDWREEAARGESALLQLSAARRDLKESRAEAEESRAREAATAQRLQQIEERCRDLEGQILSAEHTRDELLSLQDDLRRETTEAQLQLQEARDQCASSSLEAEQQAKQSAAERSARAEAEDRINDLTEQLSSQRNSALSVAERLSAKEEECARTGDMLDSARQETEQLRSQISKLKDQADSSRVEHRSRVKALQDQLEQAQASLTSVRQELRRSEERAETAKSDADALRLNVDALHRDLDAARSETQQGSLAMTALKADLQAAETAHARADGNVHQLQHAISSIKEETARTQKHHETELTSVKSDLERMRARALGAEEASAAAEQRVTTLQEEIKLLEQTVGDGRRMLHYKLGDAERECGRLEEENVRLRKDCDSAARMLAQATDDLQQANTAEQALQEAAARSEQRERALLEKIDGATSELVQLRTGRDGQDRRIQELTLHVSGLTAAKEELMSELSQVQEALRHVRDNELRLQADLDAAMFEADSKVSTAQQDLRAQQRRLATEESQVQELQQSLREMKAINLTANENAYAAERRAEALEQSVRQLQASLDEQSIQHDASTRAFEGMKQQLVDARRSAEAKHKESNELLVRARRELTEAQGRGQRREDELHEEVRSLQSQLKTQTDAADTLQGLMSSMSKQLQSAFPIDVLQAERSDSAAALDRALRTPPFASSASASPLVSHLGASVRHVRVASGAGADDPVRCVELVFSTCTALQDHASHYKTEALALRDRARQLDAQRKEDVARLKGGVEAQMTSGFRQRDEEIRSLKLQMNELQREASVCQEQLQHTSALLRKEQANAESNASLRANMEQRHMDLQRKLKEQLAAEMKRVGVLEATLQSAWHSLASLKRELPLAGCELPTLNEMESLLTPSHLKPSTGDARGSYSTVEGRVNAEGDGGLNLESLFQASGGAEASSRPSSRPSSTAAVLGTQPKPKTTAADHVSKVLEEAQRFAKASTPLAPNALCDSSRSSRSASPLECGVRREIIESPKLPSPIKPIKSSAVSGVSYQPGNKRNRTPPSAAAKRTPAR